MLAQLRVRNLAIIRDASVQFAPGLNVITGETGAGKSILMNALGLLTGGRAHRDLIRTGEEELWVEGVFHHGAEPSLRRELAELGRSVAGQSSLVISRTYNLAGRSRVRVNDRPCPVSALRRLGPLLVEIHGQHDHRLLLDVELHRRQLDIFGGNEELLGRCGDRHRRLEELLGRLRSQRMDAREKARKIEFLRFQIEEIGGIAPRPNEDLELREEKSLLAHAEEISSLSRGAWGRLQGDEANVLEALVRVERELSRLHEIVPSLAALGERCTSMRLELEDLAATLGEYARNTEFDPGRQAAVEERLFRLEGLKRKYGPELTDVLRFVEDCREQLAELERDEAVKADLEAELDSAARAFGKVAEELSRKRGEDAAALKREMEQELAGLALARSVFDVRLVRERQTGSPLLLDGEPLVYDAAGVDRVEFFISPNPGEEPRALARIASGGELSRIMLALRNVIRADSGAGRALVFDEVDAGIGGRTASVVGRKLRAIAGGDQVICVTHLPQICAVAHRHLSVSKAERRGRTQVEVCVLDGDERIAEIARMLGGEQVPSPEVLNTARTLVEG